MLFSPCWQEGRQWITPQYFWQRSQFTRWFAQPCPCLHVSVSRTGQSCEVTYQNCWQSNNHSNVSMCSLLEFHFSSSLLQMGAVWGDRSNLRTAGTVIRFLWFVLLCASLSLWPQNCTCHSQHRVTAPSPPWCAHPWSENNMHFAAKDAALCYSWMTVIYNGDVFSAFADTHWHECAWLCDVFSP